MRKILLLIVILSIFLSSCSFITTTEESTTLEFITTTEETTTTLETLSLEEIEQTINTEFSYIENILLLEIADDYILPDVSNSLITIEYLQDATVLPNKIFLYTPNISDTQSVLTIKLTYEGITLSRDYYINMVENESLYYANLKATTFAEIDFILDEEIPNEIESDLKLPEIDIDGVDITYSFNTSYVYNGYFVFPFPEENTPLNLTANIVFMGEEVTKNFAITMKGINNLKNVPKIYIDTVNQDAVDSKEEYVRATFSMTVYDNNNQPFQLLNNLQMQIRARGNSTFYMPKLSYKMKFDNKTSLIFNYQEKDWVLLANFSDQTLIRNYLANQLSEDMNMEFSPKAEFVDVFLNGQLLGNYMLTDQVEVTNDRVDIEEHSTDIDTGYLIEMDKRQLEEYRDGVEGIDYFILYGYPYTIKSPQTDSIYYSQEQYWFIEDYLNTVHLTLMNQNDYSNLIVESTFIDWFIIEEVFQNVDSGYSSVYMYKDKGEKLKMGPIWDFDLSLGNPGHLGDDLRQPTGWYTSLEFKNIWYHYLMQYPSFRENLKTRWNELYNHQIQDLLNNVYPTANAIAKSRYVNFVIWDVIGSWQDWYTAPEIFEADTYQKQLEFLYNYLYIRIEWLNQEINKF
ncbi:CotH kinase family protein [Candidatus Izemoplasma sp. B36]|uniref:CotH kinase family protein n=1 Tax=Candidatus Izemoplasma sp. B36 TaxID=3242468 RepID=UPI00355638E1